MKKISLSVFYLLFALVLHAQELNARVEIQSPNVPNTNKRTLDLLQKLMYDFLNNRNWTGQNVSPQERIDCSFIITIREWDGSKDYKAAAQVFSSRPVYGTNYSSPVLAYHDQSFHFSYTEGEHLDFSEQANPSSLSSLLAFYANVIIGMDGDTFKLYGGTRHLNAARSILNAAQGFSEEGWRSMQSLKNRYWLINNLLDRKYRPYREFFYRYHIDGLDKMVQDETKARTAMADLLDKLKEVDPNNTGNVLTSVLFSAKSNEFVGIFGKLPGNMGVKVYNDLVALDPGNTTKYEALKSR